MNDITEIPEYGRVPKLNMLGEPISQGPLMTIVEQNSQNFTNGIYKAVPKINEQMRANMTEKSLLQLVKNNSARYIQLVNANNMGSIPQPISESDYEKAATDLYDKIYLPYDNDFSGGSRKQKKQKKQRKSKKGGRKSKKSRSTKRRR